MTSTTDPRIANMDKQIELPRKNGELVFEAPWEARAFGLAVALNETGMYAWRDFSQGLANEIAAFESVQAGSPYYEWWLAALEALVIAKGLVTREEFEVMVEEQAQRDAHDHDHDDHNHAHDHDHHHLENGV